jgi:mono/diheme cytochrome c family protein
VPPLFPVTHDTCSRDVQTNRFSANLSHMPPLVLFLLLSLAAFSDTATAVDFVREVQPIFEKHCHQCHGVEKQKSGYRLDVREIALTGGESHAPNIVPGEPAKSPLLRFVSGEEAEMRMPPKGELLTPQERRVLESWVAAGAVWPESASVKVTAPTDWWSLQPLRRPVPPSGQSNPVDAFVRARLSKEGWTPSPEAPPETLLRRVAFDLTGLPPTPEELDAFLADRAPGAYNRVVERLLASPRYGERWARHWLDVVHYGDTHGYDKDKPRPNAWPYRDYVIRALNGDKPYAQFIREQIAGDVLFPGLPDGIEALGFLAAGPWDFIGHAEVPETKTDGKIARHLDRDDMVANTLGTFCATTVHCAQCHNHKFDPITQEDYYSLHAVYAAVDRTDKKYFADAALTSRYAVLEADLRNAKTASEAVRKEVEKEAGPRLAKIDEALTAARKTRPPARAEGGFHSGLSTEQNKVKWVQVDLGRETAIQRIVVAGCYDDFNKIGAGFGFPVRYRIEASNTPDFTADKTVIVDRSAVDQVNPGTALQSFPADGVRARYVRLTAPKLAHRKDDYILALAELQVFDTGGENVALGAAVSSLDSIEGPPRWQRKNLTDGVFPGQDSAAVDVAALEKERAEVLRTVPKPETRARLAKAVAEQARIETELKGFPEPKVAYVGAVHHGSGSFRGTGPDGGKPRPVHLLARGQVTQPVREVGPGAIAALSFRPSRFVLSQEATEGARRAALADWVADPANPLTWRAIVNRVWQYHFGAGLVETPGDFGRNGALPTHPELLDWLAAEFRDGGGSLKALHRLIVSSETYRQSSAARPELEEKDSGNRLLWRQNRRKLEAEAVRDAVLAASGRLDLTMGGPGWQDFVVEQPAHSPHYRYDLHDPLDPKTFRRSVYRFIVRSQTQPWMTSLDCADPSMRVDRRNESLSPLQALALLNNGFLLCQAQALAERVQSEAGGPEAAVERAFRLALSRVPKAGEAAEIRRYAARHGLPQACRILLNLNEFSFVD